MRHMPILRLLERSNLGRMILIGSFARTNLVLHVLPLVDRYDPIAEIVAKKGTKLRITNKQPAAMATELPVPRMAAMHDHEEMPSQTDGARLMAAALS
jgi:hypothetical protein